MKKLLLIIICLKSLSLVANPYPNPDAVPKDAKYIYPTVSAAEPANASADEIFNHATKALRVDVSWSQDKNSETYKLERSSIELSSTESLIIKSSVDPQLGSFKGVLLDLNGNSIAYDSVGTGKEYRKLTRGLTFRFPIPKDNVVFKLIAENPITGKMEEVLTSNIEIKSLIELKSGYDQINNDDLKVKILKTANTDKKILVNIYAEGYLKNTESKFWQDALKIVNSLSSHKFPGYDSFEIKAVFAASNKKLGAAKDLGLPIQVRDSFLGLYYPYWLKFGRWYNVLYPTSESKFRDAIGLIPYDYAIALVDDDNYWGMGNYMAFTALPSDDSSFTYLLLHEFGHFFGLNEEYNGGGPTELEFAPGIEEPWSQNITFLKDPKQLKWQRFVEATTPIPTPRNLWNAKNKGPYGAYLGGYADSEPLHTSHIPGFGCTMSSTTNFCPICKAAIEDKINFDRGLPIQ